MTEWRVVDRRALFDAEELGAEVRGASRDGARTWEAVHDGKEAVECI